MAEIVVIQASSRPNGFSSHVVGLLLERLEEEYSELSIRRFDVSDTAIKGCNGCDYCEAERECIIQDEMAQLIEDLLTADCVFVVSPVYFSGAPSQFKAVLDRLQPLFWRRLAIKKSGEPLPRKRPAFLYVVGSGGDPHGYQSLFSEVTSSFALADLRVSLMQDFIGYDSPKKIKASDLIIPKDLS